MDNRTLGFIIASVGFVGGYFSYRANKLGNKIDTATNNYDVVFDINQMIVDSDNMIKLRKLNVLKLETQLETLKKYDENEYIVAKEKELVVLLIFYKELLDKSEKERKLLDEPFSLKPLGKSI